VIDVVKLLQTQRNLQTGSFGFDPVELEGEERTEFIRWNVLALEDELHEMLGEVGWKPWASSRHVNEDPATGELVDALHFFLNLVLACAPRGSETVMVAHTLVSKYGAKVSVNAKRQADGYDGVKGKCPRCKRDVLETAVATDEGLECPCGMLVWTAP
jgi:hypothetical protein